MSDEVRQIKDRVNIVDIVGAYVQLQKAGRNYRARCPFHKERTPSFMVSVERGTYMCFGCGEKGDIFSFMQRVEGIDFTTALKQLAEKAGVKLPKYSVEKPEEKEKAQRLREICEESTVFFESEFEKRDDVKNYIAGRAVKEETRKSWRIGYAPATWESLSKYLESKGYLKNDIVDAGLAVKSEKKPGEIFDRFRGRVMFPLFDVGGEVIAFSGRIFEEMPPKTSGMAGSSADASRSEAFSAKYVNSSETELFKKSRVLYGLDRAKQAIRKLDCILLVEGQFDVVLSHQSGLPFAVAVSGTALTSEHLNLLSRLSKRLVLALDNDDAGIRAGLKATHMALGMGFDVKIPKIEGGKDPADMAVKDPDLLKTAVRDSVPAIDFFLAVLREHAKDERGYKKLIESQVVPLIAAIPSKIDQEHFVAVVARAIRVSEDAVREEVKKRPATTSILEDQTPTIEPSTASALEKAAGMLLFHFGPESEMADRIAELIGKERLLEIERKLREESERLRFEFESLSDTQEKAAGELLQRIEQIALEEDIENTRRLLRDAELSKNENETANIGKRLMELTRRRQELRR